MTAEFIFNISAPENFAPRGCEQCGRRFEGTNNLHLLGGGPLCREPRKG
jgi:hypothetical protein